MSARILLVEDNSDLAEGIEYNLRLEGYDVKIAADGLTAVEAARSWRPDLVLLDLMLPGIDGYQVLRSVRQGDRHVPVIILSARGEEADKVRGFKLDADQYVTKPFSIIELLERIAALLRRSTVATAKPESSRITFGDVDIDLAARIVKRAGTPCPLTPKAYELLLALVKRDGAVVGRNELLKEVWGYGAFIMTRTVDTHIAELRRKLELNPAEPQHIVTVWKVGYRLAR
jgi:two-component system, OmpR family, alkaline phosphatase synthesis response regulator PhoP